MRWWWITLLFFSVFTGLFVDLKIQGTKHDQGVSLQRILSDRRAPAITLALTLTMHSRSASGSNNVLGKQISLQCHQTDIPMSAYGRRRRHRKKGIPCCSRVQDIKWRGRIKVFGGRWRVDWKSNSFALWLGKGSFCSLFHCRGGALVKIDVVLRHGGWPSCSKRWVQTWDQNYEFERDKK